VLSDAGDAGVGRVPPQTGFGCLAAAAAATMPPCHPATMPPCHPATLLPCHHATMLSQVVIEQEDGPSVYPRSADCPIRGPVIAPAKCPSNSSHSHVRLQSACLPVLRPALPCIAVVCITLPTVPAGPRACPPAASRQLPAACPPALMQVLLAPDHSFAGWLEAHTLQWDEMLPLLRRAGGQRCMAGASWQGCTLAGGRRRVCWLRRAGSLLRQSCGTRPTRAAFRVHKPLRVTRPAPPASPPRSQTAPLGEALGPDVLPRGLDRGEESDRSRPGCTVSKPSGHPGVAFCLHASVAFALQCIALLLPRCVAMRFVGQAVRYAAALLSLAFFLLVIHLIGRLPLPRHCTHTLPLCS
jgi:hypothetical protein